MQSEEAWIQHYYYLPYENQQNAGLKKQYEEKKLFILEMKFDFMKRGFEASGKNLDETMIPILERSIELIRDGMSEADAQNQASEEFVKRRDAAQVTQ